MKGKKQSSVSRVVRLLSYCPFDKNHTIQPHKLLKHISKCKSPTRRDYVSCPFNPYHWCNFHEIDDHILQCSFRGCNPALIQPPRMSEEEAARHQNNSSFISQIPANEDRYNNQLSEMDQQFMNLNFSSDIHVGSRMNVRLSNGYSDFSKKFNHNEMRQMNQERLWEEPSFQDWYRCVYVSGVNRYGPCNDKQVLWS